MRRLAPYVYLAVFALFVGAILDRLLVNAALRQSREAVTTLELQLGKCTRDLADALRMRVVDWR
jgi:hypothetical protein